MSTSPKTTERKAILLLARSLKFLDRLKDLRVSELDDSDIQASVLFIEGVIAGNGYCLTGREGSRIGIRKLKRPTELVKKKN